MIAETLWMGQSAENGFYTACLVRLLLAGACGAAVGWQRERHEKAAGLRTHILLAVGACLFTLVAQAVQGVMPQVLQGIVTGAGFLGGGVIFREGASVKGLTTASGLWVMTGVGMAIGTGEYFIGVVATVLALVVLSVLLWVEKRMPRHPDEPFAPKRP
jgi:putative Mg2+ transporter-C (MgtC) family protein